MSSILIVIFIFNVPQGRKIYKSSRYEYSTSGADGKKEPKSYESVEPANTSQLDDLLDDLRKGPKFSADKGKMSQNKITKNTKIH